MMYRKGTFCNYETGIARKSIFWDKMMYKMGTFFILYPKMMYRTDPFYEKKEKMMYRKKPFLFIRKF